MEEEEKEELQLPLADFCFPDPNNSVSKKRRKKTKGLLIAEAKHHLKMFFKILVKSMDKNSIEMKRVSLLIVRVLKELEKEGVCFRKTVNGKPRLFKKFYCCKTLEDWKKCPKYFCPIWPCNVSSECPWLIS